METKSEWVNVLGDNQPQNNIIVNDSQEKQEILQLLNGVIENYNKINSLLKSSSKNEHVLKSRVIYGAMRKDIGSALYHANLQIKWVTTESE